MKSSPAGAARKTAERIYGLAAAKAAFETRPASVVSIAYTAALRRSLADVLREAARRRIAYREVDDEELTRMAQSIHHEGVCLLVTPRPALTTTELLARVQAPGLLIALDSVVNPHNVGAILRSTAYFGACGLVYTTPTTAGSGPDKGLPAAARRVAEGGAEYVPALCVPELDLFLDEAAQRKLAVVGCDAHADTSLEGFAWPERTVLVLGHEQRGLSREVRARCRTLLRIPGSQHIDSLNVSVAAGIFLASFTHARAHAGTHGGSP